jgi:hypothetical protein
MNIDKIEQVIKKADKEYELKKLNDCLNKLSLFKQNIDDAIISKYDPITKRCQLDLNYNYGAVNNYTSISMCGDLSGEKYLNDHGLKHNGYLRFNFNKNVYYSDKDE